MPPRPDQQAAAPVTVKFTATPDGLEIYEDDSLIGMSPMELKVGRDKVNPEDLAEEWVADNKETVDKWLEGCKT